MALVEIAGGGIEQGSVVDGVPWAFAADLEDAPPLGIVLTNACDLEHGNAVFILVAALKEARAIIHGSREFEQLIGNVNAGPVSARKWGKISKVVDDWIFNRTISRYYTVEADVLTLPPLAVDFQHLFAVPADAAELEVIARVPTPYREQMVSHFSGYLCRVGVDRPDEQRLQGLQEELAHPFEPPR